MELRECLQLRSAEFLAFSLLRKSVKVEIYRTGILPLILYGCETRSLTIRKESRPMQLEKMVYRKLSGPKRGVTAGWREVRHEELFDLHSPNITRVTKWIIIIITAIGLSPGGRGYFTCTQNMKLVTTKFKSVGLHEKHVVATWNLGNHLNICF